MKQNRRLFLLLSLLFVATMIVVAFFQYHREKAYQTAKINIKLALYNDLIYAQITKEKDLTRLNEYLTQLPDSTLRISIMDTVGRVLFDSQVDDYHNLENHIDRPEIKTANKQKTGSIIRHSESTNISYYYMAQHFGNRYIRTALPYTVTLQNTLLPNLNFLYLIALLLVITIAMVYFVSTYFNRKLQEKENTLRRKLTQNISHELKTPLAGIMGYMESLLNNPQIAPDRMHFYIERSYIQAKRLSALVQDINTLNKLNDHSELYEISDCNVAEIIHMTINDVQLQIEENYCSVNTLFPEEMNIQGNQTLLYSIFRNMIDNALLYVGRHAHIEIRLINQDNQHYYFIFGDSGKGIDEKHLPYIFDRFYRVDSGRRRKEGGTGLGLSIVKNAIDFHGGNITAENKVSGGLQYKFSLRKKNR